VGPLQLSFAPPGSNQYLRHCTLPMTKQRLEFGCDYLHTAQ